MSSLAGPDGAPGTLYLVPTPIGNLRDISLRALDVLGSVALIAAEDTRKAASLLSALGIRARTVSYHDFNERPAERNSSACSSRVRTSPSSPTPAPRS